MFNKNVWKFQPIWIIFGRFIAKDREELNNKMMYKCQKKKLTDYENF